MKGVAYTIAALLLGMLFLLLLSLHQNSFPLLDYFETKNQVDAFRTNVKLILSEFVNVSYNGTGYWVNATNKSYILDKIEAIAAAQGIDYEDNGFSSEIALNGTNISVVYSSSMPHVDYAKPKHLYLEVEGNISRVLAVNFRPGDIQAHVIVRNDTDVLLDTIDNISYTQLSRIRTDEGWIFLGPYVYVDFNSTMRLFVDVEGNYTFYTNATFVYDGGRYNLTLQAI